MTTSRDRKEIQNRGGALLALRLHLPHSGWGEGSVTTQTGPLPPPMAGNPPSPCLIDDFFDGQLPGGAIRPRWLEPHARRALGNEAPHAAATPRRRGRPSPPPRPFALFPEEEGRGVRGGRAGRTSWSPVAAAAVAAAALFAVDGPWAWARACERRVMCSCCGKLASQTGAPCRPRRPGAGRELERERRRRALLEGLACPSLPFPPLPLARLPTHRNLLGVECPDASGPCPVSPVRPLCSPPLPRPLPSSHAPDPRRVLERRLEDFVRDRNASRPTHGTRELGDEGAGSR